MLNFSNGEYSLIFHLHNAKFLQWRKNEYLPNFSNVNFPQWIKVTNFPLTMLNFSNGEK